MTPEDSVAINDLVDAEKDFLSSTDDIPDAVLTVTIPTDVLDSVISKDTTSRRYIVSSVSFDVTDTLCGYGFEEGLDTTVTVFIHDTLKGSVLLEVDSVYEQGDTTATALDTTLTKVLRYYAQSAVLSDSTSETWYLTKYSGGLDGYTPDVETAPQLDEVIIKDGYGDRTIVFQPDTSEYGIRGLYEPIDIITLLPSIMYSIEDITVRGPDTLQYLIKGSGDWVVYQPGMMFSFPDTGYYRLYIMGIYLPSLVYQAEEWQSVIWGITVIVE